MQCFICGKASGRIIKFTDATLQRCINILAFRKVKKFKYWEAELSYESRANTGYHVTCYKLFAVLKSKYRAEFDSLVSPKLNSPSPPENYPFIPDNQPDNFEAIFIEYMPEIVHMANPETYNCHQTGNENSTIPQESKEADIKQPPSEITGVKKDPKDFHERKPKKHSCEPPRRPYSTRKRSATTQNANISKNTKKEPMNIPYQNKKRRPGRPRKNPKKELRENRSISSNQPPSELPNSEGNKEDDADIFAKGVASKLRKLNSENLKIIVQRDIDMMLYEAIIGTGRYSYSSIEKEFLNSNPAGGPESNGYLESTVKIEETELSLH